MLGALIQAVDKLAHIEELPKYPLLSSWHIPDEPVRSLPQPGFEGKFILPLPTPRVVVG